MTEAIDLKGNIESVFFGSADDVTVTCGEIVPDTVATYTVTYTCRGKDYTFQMKCTDLKAPEIEVQPVTADTVETVTESAFIVSRYDDSPYSLSVSYDDQNKSEGTYKVTVTAKDSYGNTTVKETTLTRVLDTEEPELTGFQREISIKAGTSYNPGMYTAADNMDTSVKMTVDTSRLDTETPGDYTVTYTLKDRSGNESVYEQTVHVLPVSSVSEKTVYLTFDDGPSAITEDILEVLDEYDVPATFFVTGVNPDYADLLSEIAQKGHAIGLHTYSHVYSNIYSSEDAYYADLQKISDLVEEKTGEKPTMIRFAGGSSNLISSAYSEGIMTDLARSVQENGYTYFDWTTDSGDREDIDSTEIYNNVLSGLALDQTVILFHDSGTKTETVKALADIIETYQANGYTFALLQENMLPVHHNILN
jgi:peptidoglycan/xylan/chitin deacetylase (PgdA/CDA1 family)